MPNVVCGAFPEALQGASAISREAMDPMGFCLYGYVHALFIEFRHTVPHDGHAAGHGLTGDPRLATCHARRPLLQVVGALAP